jgi:hypothetical protein
MCGLRCLRGRKEREWVEACCMKAGNFWNENGVRKKVDGSYTAAYASLHVGSIQMNLSSVRRWKTEPHHMQIHSCLDPFVSFLKGTPKRLF